MCSMFSTYLFRSSFKTMTNESYIPVLGACHSTSTVRSSILDAFRFRTESGAVE